ncbi:hypothetical protein BMS3Abin12_00948 [bacterium BMS3Abin12]|nr:hypothetical protein BMS3Abin12_00948 [bacterium BMS3Abin12]
MALVGMDRHQCDGCEDQLGHTDPGDDRPRYTARQCDPGDQPISEPQHRRGEHKCGERTSPCGGEGVRVASGVAQHEHRNTESGKAAQTTGERKHGGIGAVGFDTEHTGDDEEHAGLRQRAQTHADGHGECAPGESAGPPGEQPGDAPAQAPDQHGINGIGLALISYSSDIRRICDRRLRRAARHAQDTMEGRRDRPPRPDSPAPLPDRCPRGRAQVCYSTHHKGFVLGDPTTGTWHGPCFSPGEHRITGACVPEFPASSPPTMRSFARRPAGRVGPRRHASSSRRSRSIPRESGPRVRTFISYSNQCDTQ